MSHTNGENPRLRLDPQATERFLQHLRAELEKESVSAITVDLGGVERVDPATLQSLRTAGDEVHVAGRDLYVDGAVPLVYKALQLAKLGPFFKRLHHATAID
jgi:anti-anti-sigma regulatory factor